MVTLASLKASILLGLHFMYSGKFGQLGVAHNIEGHFCEIRWFGQIRHFGQFGSFGLFSAVWGTQRGTLVFLVRLYWPMCTPILLCSMNR